MGAWREEEEEEEGDMHPVLLLLAVQVLSHESGVRSPETFDLLL